MDAATSELAVALADAGSSRSWPRLTRMMVPSAMHRSTRKSRGARARPEQPVNRRR
jgi:hypothetical protein